MPSQLYLGDESKLKMPNTFKNVDRARLLKAKVLARTSAAIIGEDYREVKLNAIVGDSPLQVRAPFDPERDEEDRALVESLAADGQRVPILLVEIGDEHITYTPLDGHRRLAALRQLGHEAIKAIIVKKETLECDLITLTANVRKHQAPLEQARAIARLRERHELTLENIARQVGLSRRYLSDLMALLETDPAIQAALENGSIKAKTALVLRETPREYQPELAEIAAANHLSETEAKRYVARMQETNETPKQVALSLGLATTEKESEDQLELAAVESQAPHPTQLRKRTKAKSALTQDKAEALIESSFPELETRTAKLLVEQATKHSADSKVLKAAGLLVLGGLTVDKALDAAWPIAHNTNVQKLLLISDVFVDLHSLAGRGRCVPECATLLAGLSKQMARLKQAVTTIKHPNQAQRRSRHGTSQKS